MHKETCKKDVFTLSLTFSILHVSAPYKFNISTVDFFEKKSTSDILHSTTVCIILYKYQL